MRSDIEEAMATQRYTDAGSAPRIVLRFLAAPTDINLGGKVHGGIVMRWIDEAALPWSLVGAEIRVASRCMPAPVGTLMIRLGLL
jgi:acyl-CoA hydrolase